MQKTTIRKIATVMAVTVLILLVLTFISIIAFISMRLNEGRQKKIIKKAVIEALM